MRPRVCSARWSAEAHACITLAVVHALVSVETGYEDLLDSFTMCLCGRRELYERVLDLACKDDRVKTAAQGHER